MGSLDFLSLTVNCFDTNTTTIYCFGEVLIPASYPAARCDPCACTTALLLAGALILPLLSIVAPTTSSALGLPDPPATQGLPPPPSPVLPMLPDIPDLEPTILTDIELANIFPLLADDRTCKYL